MRIGAKLYHIRTGSGAGARHLFAGEFRKRAGNCSSALENRGAMNENRTCGTAAASNAERFTQCAFLPEPSKRNIYGRRRAQSKRTQTHQPHAKVVRTSPA